jgi:predicted GTPase
MPALYREQLSRLDLVLWLIKADDRALAVDEHFYHQVIGEAYRHKVLFVISQSDKTEPTSGGGDCPQSAEAEYQPQNLPAA